MTPKEKAQELIKKMGDEAERFYTWEVKACALIAVDEILEAIDWHIYESPNREISFWQEVKQEINNL